MNGAEKCLYEEEKNGDIKRVAEIYDNIITEEENGMANVGWVREFIPPSRPLWTRSTQTSCSLWRTTAR
ncbi:MAG: hypothetical protein L6V93_16255 [Clostridiales bacterium]|nr:MAG: hypothetical protein L6V93_16255 [Clostridiales bacterium]